MVGDVSIPFVKGAIMGNQLYHQNTSSRPCGRSFFLGLVSTVLVRYYKLKVQHPSAPVTLVLAPTSTGTSFASSRLQGQASSDLAGRPRPPHCPPSSRRSRRSRSSWKRFRIGSGFGGMNGFRWPCARHVLLLRLKRFQGLMSLAEGRDHGVVAHLLALGVVARNHQRAWTSRTSE